MLAAVFSTGLIVPADRVVRGGAVYLDCAYFRAQRICGKLVAADPPRSDQLTMRMAKRHALLCAVLNQAPPLKLKSERTKAGLRDLATRFRLGKGTCAQFHFGGGFFIAPPALARYSNRAFRSRSNSNRVISTPQFGQ